MMLEQAAFRTAPAAPENVVCAPNVRISLLTDRMVRFEWSADGKFEDRETLAVLNRDLGRVKFKTSHRDGKLVITTDSMTIELLPDGKKLSAENLNVTFELNGKKIVWTPDSTDDGNLLGTCRTLDGCDGDEKIFNWYTPEERREKLQLCKGFLSRSGWSVIDDSRNVAIKRINGNRKWVTARELGERQDLYLLAYGHAYADALHDAAEVFGSQPVPPRFALGYWYSRYWAYSDREIEQLVDGFDRAGIPIDVMVIDMDWHLEGWTGYTWDRRYFPDPNEFLAHLHRRGCKVTLNLHPADGVGRHEEQFEAMARAMGLDPEKVDRVPFDITDPKYMKNYFKLLHHPEEKRGVDFWWMDWQQGESTAIPGLDTLPWINHLHWVDMLGRRNRHRPLIFSRFGGVGAGRYVIGFSGDTVSNWDSLKFQPWFTATAANVLYGYWSHDLGGHMPGNIDPELYLRWIQFGMYSPIMRTHTTKNADAERRFWAYPEPFSSLMGDVVRRRYELVPYIYSEDRYALESGVSLCHPLYYEYPEEENAYTAKQEYMFGREMLLAPVVSPVNPESELAEAEIWLPEGEWYDVAAGSMLKGGRTISRKFMLKEVPVFVRPGTVIPEQRNCRRLNDRSYSNLVMTVYPGESGAYDLYEDDGITTDYLDGKFARIAMAHRKKEGVRTLSVVHREGTFAGFLRRRELEFHLVGVVPPEQVEVNGKNATFCYRFEDAKLPAWRYDGATATLMIRAGSVDLDEGVEVRVTYGVKDEFVAVDGLRGLFARLDRVAEIHNMFSTCHADGDRERLGQELDFASVRISRRPESFEKELAGLRAGLPELPKVIKAQTRVRSRSNAECRRLAKIAGNLLADCPKLS